jgi:peptidoglycan/xylan/chitin deacetylase (PgdA/CDA1 family)
VIPESIRRRARWVLDTIGARDLELGVDIPYDSQAWERVARGERPTGDELAEAFFHLARIEELVGPRDVHGRFSAGSSCIDLLDPPGERLRRTLGVDPPRWKGARFAVALTHDVDVPWRWTRIGVKGSAARLKSHVLARHRGPAVREARALAGMPLHRLRGTDPNWCFEALLEAEAERGASSTFFLLAGHHDGHDGPSPETYDRLRPRLVRTIRERGGEVGLHGSYRAARDRALLAQETRVLEELGAEVRGHRYHYLRVDCHENLACLPELGIRYDTTVGFPDAIGFRAGIAHPYRPWDVASDRPLDLVEIPLAAMDVTLGEERYLGLSASEAEGRLLALLDWAAENGGAFSVLWHTDRFDHVTARGWDRLYFRLIDAVHERGGICLAAGELAAEAEGRLPRA